MHEVAHVVGASNAMGKEVADVAVIVKMIRVIMLVPVLLSFGWFARSRSNSSTPGERKIVIPWFAFLFLLAIGVNSILALPTAASTTINTLDTFALTMAMTAFGLRNKFRQIPTSRLASFCTCLSALYLASIGWLLHRKRTVHRWLYRLVQSAEFL